MKGWIASARVCVCTCARVCIGFNLPVKSLENRYQYVTSLDVNGVAMASLLLFKCLLKKLGLKHAVLGTLLEQLFDLSAL